MSLSPLRLKLGDRTIAWLDETCGRITRRSAGGSGKPCVARTALIRALIAGAAARPEAEAELVGGLVLAPGRGKGVHVHFPGPLLVYVDGFAARLRAQLHRKVPRATLVQALIQFHISSGAADPDDRILEADPVRRGRPKSKEGA